jgi:hypothetical protein
MSKGNTFETDFLALIFNGTTIADLAENDTTSPATSLYVSLHTADPGEAGTQSTSEAAYTSYAREAVVRTSGGWTVASGAVSNAAAITFTTATGGTETLTYFGIGVDSTGAGYLLYYGPLNPSVAVVSGVTPSFAVGELGGTED